MNLPPRKPSDLELEILRVLWRIGPATVREVQDELPRDSGYTTVLKTLQIMTEKELVARDEAGKAHVYRAIPTEDQAQKRLVEDLLERAFGGAAQKLVLHALSGRRATPEELEEIRRLLDEMEDKAG